MPLIIVEKKKCNNFGKITPPVLVLLCLKLRAKALGSQFSSFALFFTRAQVKVLISGLSFFARETVLVEIFNSSAKSFNMTACFIKKIVFPNSSIRSN